MKKQGITELSLYNEDFVNETDVLLCLNYKNNGISSCISSLTISQTTGDGIEIASRTNERYQGRQFNKLLRAVIIIIGSSIKYANDNAPIQFIVSIAENPISAYLMINTFKARPFPFPFADAPPLPPLIKSREDKVPIDAIETYMDKPEGETKYKNKIETIVLINNAKTKETIAAAEEVFENILNSYWFKHIKKMYVY